MVEIIKLFCLVNLVVFYIITSLLHCGSAQSNPCLVLPDNSNADQEKQLMDSYRYKSLLPGNGTGNPPIPNSTWNDFSFDMNDDPSNTSRPTYWQLATSTPCRQIVKVCGWERPGPTQNNWIFTQHITQQYDPNAYPYTVAIQVEVKYTPDSCRTGCVRGFILYHYNTNDSKLPSTTGQGFMNAENYHEIIRLEAPSGSGNTRQITLSSFKLDPSKTGFYLGIRDIGGCVNIARVRVYRNNCKSREVGMVIYPSAPAPVSGSANIDISCVENAVVSGSPRVTCTSNGTWGTENPVCQCRLGYIMSTPAQCTACLAGQYRSEEDTECQSCPANTVMTVVAAPVCQCVNGYFRNTESLTHPNALHFVEDADEKPSDDCTKPPSVPESVSLTPQQTSITVRWSPPTEDGGRTDLYYEVEHSDPDNLRLYTGPVYLSGVSRTHTFSGLRPFTPYCVRVTAHNGVSDQDPDGTHLRRVEVCEKTKETEPGPVQNLVSIYPTVLWQEPLRPNGAIVEYELTFSRNGSTTTSTTEGPQTFFIASEESLPAGSGSFIVEVRAKNKAGTGESVCRLTVNPGVCSTEPQRCTLCEEQKVGLVMYPATAAPQEAGSVTTVTTRCVENAVQSSDSLDVTCSSAGVWGSEQPQCRCIDNYIHNNNTGTCTAPVGTTEPTVEPETDSTPCPVCPVVQGGLSKDNCEFPLAAVLISCAATAVVVGLVATVVLILVVVCFKRKLRAIGNGKISSYDLEPRKT